MTFWWSSISLFHDLICCIHSDKSVYPATNSILAATDLFHYLIYCISSDKSVYPTTNSRLPEKTIFICFICKSYILSNMYFLWWYDVSMLHEAQRDRGDASPTLVAHARWSPCLRSRASLPARWPLGDHHLLISCLFIPWFNIRWCSIKQKTTFRWWSSHLLLIYSMIDICISFEKSA